MEEFFTLKKHYRRRGQRMAEYLVMWDEAIERLRDVDVDPGTWGDVLGWLFLRGSGLNQERYERELPAPRRAISN